MIGAARVARSRSRCRGRRKSRCGSRSRSKAGWGGSFSSINLYLRTDGLGIDFFGKVLQRL